MYEKLHTRGLLVVGAAMASALALAACNSSSSGGGGGSSSNGSGGGGGSSLTQEQREVGVAMTGTFLAEDIAEFGAMGMDAVGMVGGDSNFQDPRDLSMMLHGQDGAIRPQSWGDDFCADGGSYTIHADTADHFWAEFNNCTASMSYSDPDAGSFSMSYLVDGSVQTQSVSSPTHLYRITSTANNYRAESDTTFNGSSMSMKMLMNGSATHDWSAWNNYVLQASQSIEMGMSCNGSGFSGKFSFDDIDVTVVPSSMIGGDAEMTMSGTYEVEGIHAELDGGWTITTLEPVHFPEYGDPYAGSIRVDTGDMTVTVRYEGDTVYINDRAYTWEELDAIDDDIDDDDWDLECDLF
ncbi:MAG: hypothetical protein JJT90_16735 [Ectothiorhodospiraceae bacterium]|nr:hypothetical protein [Ectothiorhodospiraceae bacterium]